MQMKTRFLEFSLIAALTILLSSLQSVVGIRFVIDREECFSHKVEYEGDTIHFSFVVIKSEGSWHYAPDGVDLVVRFILLCNSMLCLHFCSSYVIS